MTLSPETRRKNADRELANAEFHYKIAQEGRDKLNALVKSRTADYDAALQDWSRDKSDEAMHRLTAARSQLNAVKELLQEDVTPYAKAEAVLERCREQVEEVAAVTEGIGLAKSLARQQEHFMADFKELQQQYVELMSRMHLTAQAWDGLHKQQFDLARRAGLSAAQFQRRIEAWGFDAQPLKRVLIRDPLDDNATLAFRTVAKLPPAVDGSSVAAAGQRAVMDGIVDYYRQKGDPRPPLGHAPSRPPLTAMQELQAEERELARRAQDAAARVRRAEQDSQLWEAEQDSEYSAREAVEPSMTRRIVAANAGDDDE